MIDLLKFIVPVILIFAIILLVLVQIIYDSRNRERLVKEAQEEDRAYLLKRLR